MKVTQHFQYQNEKLGCGSVIQNCDFLVSLSPKYYLDVHGELAAVLGAVKSDPPQPHLGVHLKIFMVPL